MADTSWRDSVRVVRGGSLDEAVRASPSGRVTAFDFTGAGRATWVGAATQAPGAETGAHHHGRHEVVIYVVRGRSEIRWGEHLEYLADVEPGDLVYFAPGVPHQERNPSASEPVQFLVIRSDGERIAVALDTVIAERPERVY